MALTYKRSYTSVTLTPPPNWNSGSILKDNQTVAADGNGAYTIAPCAAATLESLVSQGWFINSLTA